MKVTELARSREFDQVLRGEMAFKLLAVVVTKGAMQASKDYDVSLFQLRLLIW